MEQAPFLKLSPRVGMWCRGVSDTTRPLWGMRQITDVSDYGLRREIHVYRSLFLLFGPADMTRPGPWDTQHACGTRAPRKEPAGEHGAQSCTSKPSLQLRNRKQAAHLTSPYFTFQVTSLPQLPVSKDLSIPRPRWLFYLALLTCISCHTLTMNHSSPSIKLAPTELH